MAGRVSSFAILLGFLASVVHAQWQAVPSPADRVFAFVQSSTGIFAGSEDSGLWRSTNGGQSFAVYPTGLPEMIYDIRGFELRGDTIWVAIAGGGVCRSVDGGATWSSFNEGFETQAFAMGVKQIGDTVYAAIDYAAGLQPSGVYKTSVKQANWIRSGEGFPANLFGVTSIAVTNAGDMFVGATLGGPRGNVQVSVDRGQAWLNRSINGVQGVLTFEADADTIYAGTTDGIYVTRDNAANWERLGSLFQSATVDDILFLDDRWFAAVDGIGVVFSNDKGASWNTFTGNLPIENDFVSALFIYGGKLFAGLSAAHGVWSRPLPATGVEEPEDLPSVAVLEQNYPNPFNPGTQIFFTLPRAEFVTLKVYNVLGKEVATIFDHQKRAAGSNAVWFNAANLASGYYFYRLRAGDFTQTKRMLLLR